MIGHNYTQIVKYLRFMFKYLIFALFWNKLLSSSSLKRQLLNQCFLQHFSHPLSMDFIHSPSDDLQYLCSSVLQQAFDVGTLYMGKSRKRLVFRVLKDLILGSYVNSKLSLYTRQQENGEQVGFSFSLAFEHHQVPFYTNPFL